MRWAHLIVLAACGCSLDWSEAQSGASGAAGTGAKGGTAGSAGASSGGAAGISSGGAAGISSGGVAGVPSGGSAGMSSGGSGGDGGAPGGQSGVAGSGGGITPCDGSECLGLACDAQASCGGGAVVPCCQASQACATPVGTTTPTPACVPQECWDQAGETVSCNAKNCPDLCSVFGMLCCPDKTCKGSC